MDYKVLTLTCMDPEDGPPRTRCLRSGGRMFSRIRFSWSRVACDGPWLLITVDACSRPRADPDRAVRSSRVSFLRLVSLKKEI